MPNEENPFISKVEVNEIEYDIQDTIARNKITELEESLMIDISLPSEYERILGITYDTNVYYKITNFHLRGSDTVRISLSVNKACNVFGCYQGPSANDNYDLYVSTSSGSKYFRYGDGTYLSYWSSNNLGKRFDIVYTPTGSTGMPQDSTWTPATFEAENDLIIGSTSETGTSSKLDGNIWGSFIVDDRLELIPCMRVSDHIIGYYDSYSKIFYPPVTGTPISLGKDTSYLVPALGNYMVKGRDYVTAGQVAGSELGDYATAEGEQTFALGKGSHAEGRRTIASGNGSHAEGNSSKSIFCTDLTLTGEAGATEYLVTFNTPPVDQEGYPISFSPGEFIIIKLSDLGYYYDDDFEFYPFKIIDCENTYDEYTLLSSILTFDYPLNEEENVNISSFYYSNSGALGFSSHAEGEQTTAFEEASHAEGYHTTASGYGSHAEGDLTMASGDGSHAEGYHTTASGSYSHAEGSLTITSGDFSHAEGEGTTAKKRSQHVFGEYNVLDVGGTSASSTTIRGDYVEIVGNGIDELARSNARTLDWSGNEVLAGKLTVGAAPTTNMDVTTKQYVDNAILAAGDFTHPINIASNTDLNTLTTPGVYKCDTSAIAGTLTNCPTSSAFIMFVIDMNGSILQKITNAAQDYKRTATGTTFTAWKTDGLIYYINSTLSVASNAQILRLPASGTSRYITANSVVLSMTFANPAAITSEVSWTSYDGYITFTGTCTSSTTASIILGCYSA